MQKQLVFGYASQTCTECHRPCKSPRKPKTVDNSSRNGQKGKNDEFLVIPLKHRLSVMGLVNHLKNPKLWTIAHENGPKI
jgi:hypothetical protein